MGDGLGAPGGQGLLKGLVRDDAAEHPPDGCGLAAEVELFGGGDEGLAGGGGGGVGGFFGFEVWLGDVEGLD